MSPESEPEDIRFDDLTSLTDWTPTDHGQEVTVKNLALWLLSMIEVDEDVGQMRVVLGASRTGLSSIRVEDVGGTSDDSCVVVLR
jgi:hypothetical protein